jgi:hypothetical protein
MESTDKQAQGLYWCYRLANVIYPGWQYRSVEIVRIDERTGNLYVQAYTTSILRLNQQEVTNHDSSKL